jgi:hypothetical protein
LRQFVTKGGEIMKQDFEHEKAEVRKMIKDAVEDLVIDFLEKRSRREIK